jgi:hypothetical protein
MIRSIGAIVAPTLGPMASRRSRRTLEWTEPHKHISSIATPRLDCIVDLWWVSWKLAHGPIVGLSDMCGFL